MFVLILKIFVRELFPFFYLPQSLLRRICSVSSSNKGTQKRRRNEGDTEQIRSKWVCEGAVEGEEGLARQNAKSEEEGQDNGGLWRGIWLVIFRYDCVCGCGAWPSGRVAGRKRRAGERYDRRSDAGCYRISLFFYRKTINFFCFSFVSSFFLFSFAYRKSEIMYHV